MQPTIMGFVGLQGTGKTMAMTAMGYLEHRTGKKIYANYHLKKPFTDYTYIDSLEQLEHVHSGVVLLDEFWLWVFSRSSMTRVNQDIVKIIMLNRKRDVSILYTQQTYKQIDRLIRGVTNYWVLPEIRAYLVPDKEKIWEIVRKDHPYISEEEQQQNYNILYAAIEEAVNQPENYYVNTKIYDANGYYIRGVQFKDLSLWGSMYDTREEISDLKIREAPFTIREGIEMENLFVESTEKVPWIHATDHLPNSGKGTGRKFDVIAQTQYGTLGIDVKSTNQTRVSVHPEHLEKQIGNAKAHNLIPFIVFPRRDKIDKKENLKQPENWMAHPIEGSYLLGLKQPPKYGKLEKNSIEFPLLSLYLQNQIQDREAGTLSPSEIPPNIDIYDIKPPQTVQ